jgi:hypothetical protein
MLDRDERVNPPEQHGVYVHKVDCKDGLGLRGEELAPGRTRSARCGGDASVVQDLPHGGGGGPMAEPDQFTLDAPVSPGGILRSHADHQFLDRRCGRRTSGPAVSGVVPFP